MEEKVARERTTLFYIKRIAGLILLLTTAAVFLFSGISKLYGFEGFVWTIIDAGVNSLTGASILARLFIGFELLIGVFLIGHLFLRSFTYPATIVLLTLFTIYLVLLLMQQGNTGDCGCFGEAYTMTPLNGIFKNILMIAGTLVLRKIYPVKPYKHQEWIAAFAGMAAIVVPFLFFPLSADTHPEQANEPINMNALYSNGYQPAAELRTGKHIVAFMSLTCPHCRKAAKFLAIIHHQHPEIPIFLVLAGAPEHENDFFTDTKAITVPHMLFRDPDAFLKMAGPGVPAIYWINNSIIEWKSNYYELDPQIMINWIKK